MKYVRLMVRVSPHHKKAVSKVAKAAKPRVSESSVIRDMLETWFPSPGKRTKKV